MYGKKKYGYGGMKGYSPSFLTEMQMGGASMDMSDPFVERIRQAGRGSEMYKMGGMTKKKVAKNPKYKMGGWTYP